MTATDIDASLDSAVEAIMKKFEPEEGAREERDTRENRADRDVIEQDHSTDLEDAERAEREERAEASEDEAKEQKADAEGGEGEESGDEDAFIELPAEEEGGEPTRIPAAEAAEAWKQLRQMEGDIATAVIKAEEEGQAKQDQITQAIGKTFETVRDQAKIALEMMQRYLPQAPPQSMLDRASPDYDPEQYWVMRNYYDEYAAHYQKVQATYKQADDGLTTVGTQQDSEEVRRELDRAARFIPEFKDEKTREARKGEIAEFVGKHYGVTADELKEITSHKAWRMMNDLAKLKADQKKAPEVRKHIKETKPRIVNGRVHQTRDPRSGKFVQESRQRLKNEGSEAAFANHLLKSGALKDIL